MINDDLSPDELYSFITLLIPKNIKFSAWINNIIKKSNGDISHTLIVIDNYSSRRGKQTLGLAKS